MKTERGSISNKDIGREIVDKLNLTIKLLGVIATEKDFSSLTQGHQIVHLNRIGLRNKDIASVFGIKDQQVTNALRAARKKKKG
jgi:hypothetical protein